MDTECKTDNETASSAEVIEALMNLSETDHHRIKLFAIKLVYMYRAYAKNRDYDDLIKISSERILDDLRKWPKNKTDFLGFFFGVMRSVASHWKEEKDADVRVYNQIVATRDDSEFDLVENHPSEDINIDEDLIIKEQLKSIEDLFEDDDDVLLVITELREQKTGPEIQESLGITQTQYQTIIRRMRRRLKKESIEGNTNVR